MVNVTSTIIKTGDKFIVQSCRGKNIAYRGVSVKEALILLNIDENDVGVWQPKGTKEKYLNHGNH